jgi:DhnA family fructose-bisphosphate aldolase class Ia
MAFTGIDRRVARLFAKDGRSLVMAFDHGRWGANFAGMADPARTLSETIAAGADAVLTSVGQALRFGDILSRAGLVINMDDVHGDPTPAVRQALELGADMGKVMSFPYLADQPDSVDRAARLSSICCNHHLPLMIETVPGGFDGKEHHTPEKIGVAARQGAEIGADLLKIQYSGSVESFRQILAPLFVPVIVLGGAPRENVREVLTDVHGAMEAGAVGIAIGRNIWAHPTPAKMVAAMASIIHGGADVAAALKELG